MEDLCWSSWRQARATATLTPHRIISTPFVAAPGTISSETYLCIGPFNTKEEANSALSYLSCKLTRPTYSFA